MKLKQWQNIFLVIVNANPIVQHVIQKKKWNNGNGILAHVFVRIVSISKGLLII